MARIGVGVPTYNGGRYIRECLECLQNQTFEDFDVFISDNGSTDETSDICAEFARTDKRFRHVRFAETIDAASNFSRARDNSIGDYFMWRADDDWSSLDYLAGLSAALDARIEASIAVSPIRRVIELPERTEKRIELPSVRTGDPLQTLEDVLLGCHPSWFYGLWRRQAAVRDWDRVTSQYAILWASDHLALLPAILDGKVALVPEPEFVQRIAQLTKSYELSPKQLLDARRKYEEIAVGMVRARGWDTESESRVLSIVGSHIEKRVARKWKTRRKLAESWIRGLLNTP